MKTFRLTRHSYKCKKCGRVIRLRLGNCPDCSSSNGWDKVKEKKNLNEKQEKGLEFIENGLYNLGNFKKLRNDGILNLAIDQITNGKKLIEGEELEGEVFGVSKEND